MKLKIDGPFTGSYSLALVNREMALAMEQLLPGRVALSFDCHPEGIFHPDQTWLSNHADVEALYVRGKDMTNPDVVLYNSYPPVFPNVSETLCLTNAYGWEESLFPPQYVQGFNHNLFGLTLMSEFVRKTLLDNGVSLPMRAVGLGMDHIFRHPPDPWPQSLGKKFRFLHVSSCFPRKGLDVLLTSYAAAFTAHDDVSLVIKTFPNPHNTAPEQIEEFRADPEAPDIVLINEDIGDAHMLDIYQRCHCLVAPSRGEGFGLPMAEAMALHIPVITTGFGGQADFCTPKTAWLIDYSFAPARTHLSRFASSWAEPDPDHLSSLMREVFRAEPADIQSKTGPACDLVSTEYTWKACARRTLAFISDLQTRPAGNSPLSGSSCSSSAGSEGSSLRFPSLRPTIDRKRASPLRFPSLPLIINRKRAPLLRFPSLRPLWAGGRGQGRVLPSDSPPCHSPSTGNGHPPSGSPPCGRFGPEGGARGGFFPPVPFPAAHHRPETGFPSPVLLPAAHHQPETGSPPPVPLPAAALGRREGSGEGSWFSSSSPGQPPKPKVGLVTTWNCRCGIAEYSKHLVPFLLSDLDVRILAPVFTEQIGRDEPNVHRFWDKDDCADSLSDKAEELGLKALIINFHFGFFSISRLAKLINFLSDNGIQCIIIFHACRDKDNSLSAIQSALARADRLLVHSIQDLNWFKELGLVANVSLFPHGVVRLPQYPKPSSVVLPNELRGKRLLGTFGFLMPHKGVLELIQAFSRLLPRHPDLGLVLLTSLYPKPEVQEHHQECLQAIKNLGLESHVYINTDFLPLEETLIVLAKCSLIVFPYQYTGESSSAAVRVGLGSDRPVAVTPLDIFDDVQGVVHVLPGTDGQSLAQGLDRLLSDPWQLHSLDRAREEWLKIHAWQSVARRLAGMIKSWTL